MISMISFHIDRLAEIGVLLAIVFLTIHVSFHNHIRPITNDSTVPSHYHLRLLFGMAIGRFLVVAANTLLIGGHSRSKSMKQIIRSLTGHTESLEFNFVYCMTGISSNVLCLGYGENRLLVLTSSFMELSCIHLTFRRIFRLLRHQSRSMSGLMSNDNLPSPTDTRPSLKAILVDGTVLSITRIILPLVFLCLAVTKESPLQMQSIPMAWFVFCCIFYGVFHMYLFYRCIRGILDLLFYPISSLLTTLPTSSSTLRWTENIHHNNNNNRPPFSMNTQSEFHSNMNNLHANDTNQQHTSDKDKGIKSQPPNWFPSSWNRPLKGVSYGLLRCYGNKNLYSSNICKDLDQKVNFNGSKKDSGKDNRLCHTLATSTRTPILLNLTLEQIDMLPNAKDGNASNHIAGKIIHDNSSVNGESEKEILLRHPEQSDDLDHDNNIMCYDNFMTVDEYNTLFTRREQSLSIIEEKGEEERWEKDIKKRPGNGKDSLERDDGETE